MKSSRSSNHPPPGREVNSFDSLVGCRWIKSICHVLFTSVHKIMHGCIIDFAIRRCDFHGMAPPSNAKAPASSSHYSISTLAYLNLPQPYPPGPRIVAHTSHEQLLLRHITNTLSINPHPQPPRLRSITWCSPIRSNFHHPPCLSCVILSAAGRTIRSPMKTSGLALDGLTARSARWTAGVRGRSH